VSTSDDSTLPSSAEEYRQWWRECRPALPYGICWCGCGEQTELATKSNKRVLQFPGEPKRYVGYHASRGGCWLSPEEYRRQWEQDTDTPYGYCWCGCGNRTTLAAQGNSKAGYVAGEPYRYIVGHHFGPRAGNPDFGCNQKGGYCHCGCGQKTTLHKVTIRKAGYVERKHRKYIRGHVSPYDRADQARRVAEYKRLWAQQTNVPYGFCQCGCGEKTNISPGTQERKTCVKGEPHRYLYGHWHSQDGPKLPGRVAKWGAQGSYTSAEIAQMYEDQGGLCAYCETPLFGAFHADHMVPLSRGGRNDWTNLAVACAECNLRKSTKTAEEFMA
jgi:5-methylcytosine-specific restriction endonuclease McrA